MKLSGNREELRLVQDLRRFLEEIGKQPPFRIGSGTPSHDPDEHARLGGLSGERLEKVRTGRKHPRPTLLVSRVVKHARPLLKPRKTEVFGVPAGCADTVVKADALPDSGGDRVRQLLWIWW